IEENQIELPGNLSKDRWDTVLLQELVGCGWNRAGRQDVENGFLVRPSVVRPPGRSGRISVVRRIRKQTAGSRQGDRPDRFAQAGPPHDDVRKAAVAAEVEEGLQGRSPEIEIDEKDPSTRSR